jgi:hypothetical protein
MVHHLGPLDGAFREIAHVSAQELDAVGQVPALAGRKVVDHPDAAAAAEEGVDKMGADEPGAAGDHVEGGVVRGRVGDHLG